MNKCEVQNLIYECQRKIAEIREHNISSDDRKTLDNLDKALAKDNKYIAFEIGDTKQDRAKLAEYAEKITKTNRYLDSVISLIKATEELKNNTNSKKKPIVDDPGTAIVPVDDGDIIPFVPVPEDDDKKKKIPEEEKKPKKKNWKKVVAIIAACTIGISAIAYGCSKKDKDKQDDNTFNDPSISTSDPSITTNDPNITTNDPSISINSTNNLNINGNILNNPNELEKYATNILTSLNNSNLTVSDIVKAIKLANWDYLDDQKIMDSQEDLITTMQLSSYIVNTLGSDSIVYKDPNSDIYLSQAELQNVLDSVADSKITIADYNDALVNGKYDIYKLMEINLKNINEDNEKSAYFGKVVNDLMSRIHLSSTLISDCPLATRYILMARYNDYAPIIIKLTTHFGQSIYGDKIEIDGEYGYTCVESLAEFLAYFDKNGNINTANDLISIFIQLLLTDIPTLSR